MQAKVSADESGNVPETVSGTGSSAGDAAAHLDWLEQRNAELERNLALTKQALERYAGLCRSAPIAFLTLNDEGIVGEINPAALELLGGQAEMIRQRAFVERVDAESASHWRKVFKQVKFTTRPQLCELSLNRLDGGRFLAEVDVRPMELGGNPVICLILADISDKRRKEREVMEWRQEMAELRKGQIAAQTAAAIAHELNQPLLAIANYSEAALKLLSEPALDLHKVTKAVRGCEKQAQRAGKTIYELIDFLSLKEIAAESFDLNQVIDEVLHTARAEHELDFDAILSLEEQLPPVFANRLHVEKVLFNLLRNAIEAMHESQVAGPEITVTVRTKGDEHFALLTIRDNGPGVHEEMMQQLFKPFFTTKVTGIGMGLAVSRSLIEANGGQLWIDPSEKPGATFHLTLPFAP